MNIIETQLNSAGPSTRGKAFTIMSFDIVVRYVIYVRYVLEKWKYILSAEQLLQFYGMCRAEKCINLRFGHWRRVVGALRHIGEASKARSTQLPWDLPCLSTSHRTPCEKQRDGACVKRHVRLHTIQTCGHWTWKQLWRNKLLNMCLFILGLELYFRAAPLNTKTQESLITQMQQVVMPHVVWWEWWHDQTIMGKIYYGKGRIQCFQTILKIEYKKTINKISISSSLWHFAAMSKLKNANKRELLQLTCSLILAFFWDWICDKFEPKFIAN